MFATRDISGSRIVVYVCMLSCFFLLEYNYALLCVCGSSDAQAYVRDGRVDGRTRRTACDFQELVDAAFPCGTYKVHLPLVAPFLVDCKTCTLTFKGFLSGVLRL